VAGFRNLQDAQKQNPKKSLPAAVKKLKGKTENGKWKTLKWDFVAAAAFAVKRGDKA